MYQRSWNVRKNEEPWARKEQPAESECWAEAEYRPEWLIVLGKKDWPTHVYDGSLVMGNLMLAAHDLGIGSCWIHRAKEEFESDWGKKLLKSLGIEDEYEGIGHCALGYADGDYPDVIPRKENRVFYI